MRIVPFIISAFITLVLVFTLNKKWGDVPPLGKFLSPQHGFWQNAEPADEDCVERDHADDRQQIENVRRREAQQRRQYRRRQ